MLISPHDIKKLPFVTEETTVKGIYDQHGFDAAIKSLRYVAFNNSGTFLIECLELIYGSLVSNPVFNFCYSALCLRSMDYFGDSEFNLAHTKLRGEIRRTYSDNKTTKGLSALETLYKCVINPFITEIFIDDAITILTEHITKDRSKAVSIIDTLLRDHLNE
jgi:hypothetical protein